MKNSSFYAFLSNFESRSDGLLEAIKSGFSTLYEIPHGETIDGRPVDFHVEDVLQNNNREQTINYVHTLIVSLEKNNKIKIPYTNSGEVSELASPIKELSNEQLQSLVKILKYIETNMNKFQ